MSNLLGNHIVGFTPEVANMVSKKGGGEDTRDIFGWFILYRDEHMPPRQQVCIQPTTSWAQLFKINDIVS